MVSSALQLRNEVDNHCKPCASSGTPPQSSNLNVIDELRRGFIIEKTGHNREVNFAGPSRQENPLDFREKKWLTLLHERPNVYDPTRMTNWLNKVLSFSEHEMDTSRNAQIPTFPSAMTCIDVHGPFVSPASQSVNYAGISVAARESQNFGPSRHPKVRTFPSAISCIDVHGQSCVSPSSESEYDARIPVAAMERHNFGLTRNAQIQSCIDVQGTLVSPMSEAVYDAGMSFVAMERHNFGPSRNAHNQTFPMTTSSINVHGTLVSPSSEAVSDAGISIAAMDRHNFGRSRYAHIQTCPSAMSCIDVYGTLVSPSSEAVDNAGYSVSAMERHNFGHYTHSSSSTVEIGVGRTSQASAMVASEFAEIDDIKAASEVAEFDDFMDGIDASFVFV